MQIQHTRTKEIKSQHNDFVLLIVDEGEASCVRMSMVVGANQSKMIPEDFIKLGQKGKLSTKNHHQPKMKFNVFGSSSFAFRSVMLAKKASAAVAAFLRNSGKILPKL